jgi:hypothetical protein
MKATNVFRLKDLITIRVLGEKTEEVILGAELQPDRFEYGIQVMAKNKKPSTVSIDMENYLEANDILDKLAVEVSEEEPEPDTDDVMMELEKIISFQSEAKKEKTEAKNYLNYDEEDDEDLDEKVVQQTLF